MMKVEINQTNMGFFAVVTLSGKIIASALFSKRERAVRWLEKQGYLIKLTA